jgi:hypothetical protein
MPSPKSSAAKANPVCQCSIDINSKLPGREAPPTEHGFLGGPCDRPVDEPKNLTCRPCAVGNHAMVVCAKWVPVDATMWIHQKACADCGLPSDEHPLPRELR